MSYESLTQAVEAWIRHGEAVPADVTTYDRWIIHTELRMLLEEHAPSPAEPSERASSSTQHAPPSPD